MITFEPDSPWEIGDKVTLRVDDKVVGVKRITGKEESDDGMEIQYEMEDWDLGNLKRILYQENPVFK